MYLQFILSTYIHTYINAHTHTHTHTSAHTHTHTHTHMHTHTHTHTHIVTYIYIFLLGPTPDVNLTSSTLRLPTHPDYNQAILTCTATLPLPLEIDELEFDKVFTWTMSGIDVTSNATTPTDPSGIQSVSTLTRDLTIAGEIVITCEVTISVPGDPVVSNSSSVTITALGKRFLGLLRERARVRGKIVE